MSAPWNRKKATDPIRRARTTAPSSSREFQPQPPQPRDHTLNNRQLLAIRLEAHKLSSTFSVDCTGPQHARMWKVSFFLGSTMIGESSWFTAKDAAKENAAMQALGWLNTNGFIENPSSAGRLALIHGAE